MNKYITLLSLLLVAILFSQCGKLKLNPNKFYQSDFPINLNNYWEYERKDSVLMKVDTVIATITEEGIDIGDEKNLFKLEWRQKDGTAIDSQFIKVRNQAITFHRKSITDSDFLRIESQYELPFKPEDEWEVGRFLGTYRVQENIETPFFGDAYSLERDQNFGQGARSVEDILLSKGIGIIQRNITEYRFGNTFFNQTAFKLLNYHIEE